ncbi:MAG: hypothetical protein AAGA40_14755 [Cyanobacteria bacterium P01_E01_bin.45]
MVIVAGFALGVAVSLGGVFAYSMAAVASMSDADMKAIRTAQVLTPDLDGVRGAQDS